MHIITEYYSLKRTAEKARSAQNAKTSGKKIRPSEKETA